MRIALEGIADEIGVPLEVDRFNPSGVEVKKLFLFWPPSRLREVLTSIFSNVIWWVITSIIVFLVAIFGIKNILDQSEVILATSTNPVSETIVQEETRAITNTIVPTSSAPY